MDEIAKVSPQPPFHYPLRYSRETFVSSNANRVLSDMIIYLNKMIQREVEVHIYKLKYFGQKNE